MSNMENARRGVALPCELSVACVAAVVALISVSACSGKPISDERTHVAGGEVVESSFDSPEAAGAALLAAAKSEDRNALLGIFGPDANGILSSGDSVEDKNGLQSFIDNYTRMHRWRENKAGNEILLIGASNFPFPFPLVRGASGKWSFNTAAGRDELLARRIGNGELTAIGVLTEVANAQEAFFSKSHEFAQKLVSDSGQQNGLYWPVAAGQTPSPLGSLVDVAKSLGYTRSESPQPFVGYYYRGLTSQGPAAQGGAKDFIVNGKQTGGFAVLAWPVKYMDSGIMTFVVGPSGVIYQRDFGAQTSDSVAAITAYDPGPGWRVVLSPEAANASGPTQSTASR